MDARRDRDCRRADARKAAKRSPWEIHGRLLPLLNGAPGNVLTRTVRANAPAASAVALETEDLERRLRTLAALREIQLAPDIVYVPSCRMRTPRVFASAVSPAGLPRAVRKALFSGCLELDLTNAQLSIAARVWDVDVLIDHLQREGSVWPHLLAAVAGTHSLTYEEAKGALKAAVYGAVFGMSKRGLRRLLRATLSAGAAAVFLADPLVAAVLVARDRALDDIDADGGITDCFGHHRPLTAEPGSPRRKAECRSALAGGMQAYELKLLEPVVDEAIRVSSHRRPAFRIVCWLHDGFTISASAPGIEGRLVRLVAEQAERLGVPTSLEATRLGSERLTGGGATGRVRSRSARTGRANGPGAGHVVTPDHVRLAAIERGTRPGGPDGNCWMWTGAKNRDGYGYKRFGGPNKVAVHRMSWEAANGCRVPSGLVVRHTCHTPACVNPGHLVTGTQRENIADRDAAGRTARGEQNGRSSLTCDTVSEARRLAASGVPVRRIARRFGVNPSTARAAVRGKTWTHVA